MNDNQPMTYDEAVAAIEEYDAWVARVTAGPCPWALDDPDGMGEAMWQGVHWLIRHDRWREAGLNHELVGLAVERD